MMMMMMMTMMTMMVMIVMLMIMMMRVIMLTAHSLALGCKRDEMHENPFW